MALPGTMRNIMRPTALARPCAPSRHMPSAAQGGGRNVERPKAAAATLDGPRRRRQRGTAQGRRQRGAAQGGGGNVERPKAAAATWAAQGRRRRGAAQGGGRTRRG